MASLLACRDPARLASARVVAAALLAALLVGCGARPPALETPPATVPPPPSPELSLALAPLAWILGDWRAEDGASEEHWVAAAGAIYGVGLDNTGGFEVLIIDDGEGRGKADGVLRLYAMPGGAPTVEFGLRRLGAEEMTFGNDLHDFPTQVRYWRAGPALAAEIRGDDRVIPFRFRPCSYEAAPELEEADRAFAADVAARGVEGWMAAFEPGGWTVAEGKKVAGDELRARMTPFLAHVDLRWAPIASARLGDLGFTVGKATFSDRRDASSWGGTYVTLWRKQADGGWKVRFDVGRAVHE